MHRTHTEDLSTPAGPAARRAEAAIDLILAIAIGLFVFCGIAAALLK